MKSTITDLVKELESRNTPDGKYDDIISKAAAGEYHDYKNKKYAAPKMVLVEHLSEFTELDDIVKAVMNGDYDEKPDADDEEMMRKELKEMGLSDKIIKDKFGL